MKDLDKDVICPNCGACDATGITSCPRCGATLSSLDSLDGEELQASQEEKYSDDLLSKFKDTHDGYME